MNSDSPFAEKLAGISVRRQQAEVLGATTVFWEYGPPDAAVTVLVVHGFRGDHHGLEPVIAQLPHIRFVAPDLPAFGESSPLVGERHTIAGYAAWLHAFAEQVGIAGRAVVLGHSFGSIISAAAVAGGMPTPALVLINPISVSGLSGPHPFLTRITVWFYAVAARLPARAGLALLKNPLIVQFMSMLMVKTKNRARRSWIHREHHRYFSAFTDRSAVVEAFGASTSSSIADYAADIPVRTLLIAADQDDITPVSAHTPIVQAIGDAELVVIPGVGHLIHYETPEAAAAAIDAFLARSLRA